MFGQMYKYAGWYASFRSNYSFEKPTYDLSFEEGGYINEMLPFYSGNRKQSQDGIIYIIKNGQTYDLYGKLIEETKN